jgi:hypothetical protein
MMKNGDRTQTGAPGDRPSLPRRQRTSRIAAPERSLEEQSRRIDGLLRLAFNILGASFLDARAPDQAE